MKKSLSIPSISLVLLLSCQLAFFSSCKKEETPVEETPPVTTPVVDNKPVACFTADSYLRKVNQYIQFQNCSKNYERCEWNYGNGGGAVVSEPSNMWISPGTYPVSLTVFKGTENNKVTKNFVIVQNGVTINIDISYKNWKTLPSKYKGVYISMRVYKSSVANDTGFVFATWGSDIENLYLMENFTDRKIYGPLLDASTKYKFKLILQGYDATYASEFLETCFVTDEIDLISGPKTPIAAGTCTNVTMNYTLSIEND